MTTHAVVIAFCCTIPLHCDEPEDIPDHCGLRLIYDQVPNRLAFLLCVWVAVLLTLPALKVKLNQAKR